MKKLTNKIIIITLVAGLFGYNGFSQKWLWAKQAGSTNDAPEGGYSIDRDHLGNIYITGCSSTNAIFDTIVVPCYGWTNPFLARYSKNGDVSWVVNMIGSSSTQSSYGKRVKIGPDGSIFVIGTFNGNFKLGTIFFTSYGGSDGFIAKFDSNGQHVWVKHIGGDGRDYLSDFTFDADGKIYIICTSNSNSFQVDTLGYTISSPYSHTLIKISDEGIVDTVLSFHCNGLLYDRSGIIYSDNLLYLVGSFKDSIVINGTTLTSKKETYNGFIGKFNLSLNNLWLKQFEGGSGTSCTSVISDDSSNIYVAGQFADTIKFSSVYSLNNDTLADLFLAKFDSSGNIKWATQLHPDISWFTASPQIYDISFSTNGILHCTGDFRGNAFFGNINLHAVTDCDLFVAMYNKSGSCLSVRNVGNANGHGIVIDNEDNSYITGWFYDTTDFDQYSLTSYNGTEDIFIAKLSDISGIGKNNTNTNPDLQIYANPTTGKCNITIPEEFMKEDELTLRIYDQMGKLVQEVKVENVEGTLRFDIRAQAKGLYHATLSNGRKVYSGKIVFE